VIERVLVTGGAGFIGSYVVERLLAQGRRVRILDSLELPTHREKPYLPRGAEFQRGDLRRRDDVERALREMEAVVHLAATGGFTADVSRYVEVNALGTAHLLELAARRRIRKLVVASSVAVYGEGAYRCPEHGPLRVHPRPLAALERGEWEHRCPRCGGTLLAAATPEDQPLEPLHPYGISKLAGEKLALAGEIPAVALRFFLTYGPRQSLTNPYTGVVSIFAARLLAGQAPLVYEDGRQTRDFVYVEDVARAVELALDRAEAGALNVGTGRPTAIADLARALAHATAMPHEPSFTGEFRPGEARHLVADAGRLGALGWEPRVELAEGLERTLEWIAGQGGVRDVLGPALEGLRRTRVVRGMRPAPGPEPREGLSVIVPAYNEAGNLESIVRYLASEVEALVPDFEIVLVNDGSRDGTGVIADRLAAEDERVRVVHHPFNIGFGAAQKSGFRAARNTWVVVVPADHQFDARDLGRLWERRVDADLVGSRRVARRDPLPRRLVSAVYNAGMRARYGLPLRDINWVKLWRRALFDQIAIESTGFGVDAEIVAKAVRLGYRVAEVDVPHHPRTWGTPTGIRLGTLWRTGWELWRIGPMLRRMQDEARARGAADPAAVAASRD
jgi:dTDP-L-rhamnose 4-epimerase